MAVFFITTNIRNKSGVSFQFPFDCACNSVDDLARRFSEGEIIVGDKLIAEDDGHGGRTIVSRERIGLNSPAIGLIQNERNRYCEKG